MRAFTPPLRRGSRSPREWRRERTGTKTWVCDDGETQRYYKRAAEADEQQRSYCIRGMESRDTATPSSPRSGGGIRSESEQTVINKQQRLLLLCHSARCSENVDGRCTVTPHCAYMKQLWYHITGCRDNQCKVAHCFSSRAIMSHYRECSDPNCRVCGPVRAVIYEWSQGEGATNGQQSEDCDYSGNPIVAACSTVVSLPPQRHHSGSLLKAERSTRLKNLVQLVEHASLCRRKSCPSNNCRKMKSYLVHELMCRTNVQGGCKICTRVQRILRIHAQKCKDKKCAIPQCKPIRRIMRQNTKNQDLDYGRRPKMK